MGLRVYSPVWHAGHQFEFAKCPWVERLSLQFNPWQPWGGRPLLPNMRIVNGFKASEHDAAFLFFDQEGRKRAALSDLLTSLPADFPRVFMVNGSPTGDSAAARIELIKHAKAGWPVIYTSPDGAADWNVPGTHVRHGYRTDDANYDFMPTGEVRCRDERFILTNSASRSLYPESGTFTDAVFAALTKAEYRVIDLAQHPLVFPAICGVMELATAYVHTTRPSPFPRTRTEAALMGARVVTVPDHGAKDVSSFQCFNTPDEAVELVRNAPPTNIEEARREFDFSTYSHKMAHEFTSAFLWQ